MKLIATRKLMIMHFEPENRSGSLAHKACTTTHTLSLSTHAHEGYSCQFRVCLFEETAVLIFDVQDRHQPGAGKNES